MKTLLITAESQLVVEIVEGAAVLNLDRLDRVFMGLKLIE